MKKHQLLSFTYFREIIFLLKKQTTAAALFFVIMCMAAGQVAAQQIQANAARQIKSLMDEKASRTPAQKKISSQILYAFKMDKGQGITLEVASLRTNVKKDAKGMIKIEMDAVVTPQLLDALKAFGSEIIFYSEKFGNIVANIPLNKVEEVALLDAVKHIDQWVAPMNNGGFSKEPGNNKTVNNHDIEFSDPWKKNYDKPASNFKGRPDFSFRAANIRNKLNKALDKKGLKNNYFFAGAVTSEADVTHKAALARAIFGVNGTGVKIGVLSDGVTGYATSQASGDLPATITILPGQAGSGSEGRAMMELIYDLAPGAELYFATAFGSQAGFAQNILDLRAAGCDIIVDDITYFAEGVFQDDIIAQAVNTVTASGALYFSSAGNSGNKNDGTAGVWEGDFVDGGISAAPFPATGNLHSFSPGFPYNVVTANTGNVGLKWSDPLGLSGNDYDLFVTDASGATIFAAGTNVQDGNDNPYEQIGSCFAGERLYILKKTAAAPRALHLNTNRGMITYNTPGVVYGHNAGLNTISVAATPASVPNSRPNSPVGPFPGVHNSSNRVEVFSSDGPRRIFYNPNGTEITPGNLLFGTNGGTVLQKPDLTAADGTLTATPGFIPFFGTSASAPHVAAIAALVKSAAPSLNATQIKAALIASCIDIETPGVDRDAGAGIVMAVEAIQAAGVSAPSYVSRGTVTAVEGLYGNGNGAIEPGELGSMTVQLKNESFTPATGVTAVLTTSTTGVIITQNAANYGDIGAYGNATNTATPYLFGVNASVPCGTPINFTLTVTYGGGGPSPVVFNFVVYAGNTPGIITATLGGTPASGTGFTSTSGLQTNRTFRNGIAATCAVPKAAPGLSAGVNLAYHAYTFTNTKPVDQCVTVNLATTASNLSHAVVYNSSGFIAATPGTNYLADFGLSNALQTFSFNAPAGQAFTVVVHELVAGSGANAPYQLNVDLTSCSTTPPCTPVVVSPATIPTATNGASYNQAISATGGSGSYLFSLSSGTLPTGLTLSPTGIISGTPTQTGSFPISVTATDAVCPGATINYTLVVQPPLLTINDITQNEGNSGPTTFSFTVSLSAPAGPGGVTFDIATADNTATIANNDYVAKSLTSQTIPAGSLTYTFDVAVNGDVAVETDENFFVNVTNVTGAIVSDGQGLGTISNDDFDVPTITTLASSLNPSCFGSAVTFTATVTSAGNPVTVGTVTFTEGVTILASNVALNGSGQAAFTASSLTATSHNITATYSGAPGFITSNGSLTQVVNTLPLVTITPGGSTTFCAGGSVELTSSAGTSYLWSNGATSQSITVTVSGSYTVTVTDANGCSATSSPTTVTVNPLPVVSMAANNLTEFCAGGSVGLYAITQNYLKILTPQVFTIPIGTAVFGAPISTTPVSGDFVYIPDGAASYLGCSAYAAGSLTGKVALIDRGVCNFTVKVKNAQNAGAVGVIIVNNGPGLATMGGIDPAINIPSIFISQADGITLKNLINQGVVNGISLSPYTYHWSTGATTSNITVTESGNYTVTVTDANGCSATSESGPIIVNPLPAVPTITANGPVIFCDGGSVTLTSSSATGNQWYLNGNIINGATNQTYVVTASGNYTVTVTTTGGCSASSSATTVTVNPIPATPTITPNGPTVFCAGGSVTLSSSSATGNQWYLNGNAINGATSQTYMAIATGLYSVTVTTNNCTSPPSSGTTVTVNPIPNAVATPSSQSICTGNAITTIVNSGNVTGTVYSWTRDNLTVTGIAANGTGNISGTLTNSTSLPVTVTFTITPSYTNAGKTCTGTPINATVTVNPNLYFACPGNMVEIINDIICFKAVANPNPVFCGALTKLTWKLTGATVLNSPTSGINYVGLRNMNVGVTTVTYTATFAGGVVKTCSYTVTVKETIVPEIRCPLDKDVTTDPGKCYKTGPVSLGTPVVSDNCGVASVTNNAPAVYQKGVNLVTWTVTDKSGNIRTCVQRVTVYDAEKPTLTCPANVVANTGSDCTATPVTLPHPVFADNCGVVTLKWAMTGVTWGSSNGTGINYVPTMNYATGVSTVIYTAYDEAGNWQTCTFTVTVKDVTPPTLVCPPAQTFCKVANNVYTIPVMTQTDNCVIATTEFKITGVTSRVGSGTNASGIFNVGVSTIKWTVKDVNGNTSTCTTTVTILPSTNPACIITAPVTFTAPEAGAKLPVKEVVLGLSVIAYPNPTENYFNLKINTSAKETVEIRMFDMAGKLVQTNRGAPSDIYRLGENVVSGMYIIEVIQADKTVRTKVVKQ
jgi:PA domain/Bacterial Ig-like domain (group 3)/Subtilase family/Putative Ig domain/Secretion system C-terminal sorting domain/PKD-like domain/HYR domain/Ig-like domain CHU_C associated